MRNVELAELLLVRLYDLAESEGHLKLHSLNAIAEEFGETDMGKVFNVAKALEGRGLIQAAFAMGPQVHACIAGEGSLFVEGGGDTGVIPRYRANPEHYMVIDQSTHFHAPVSESNIAVHSPGAAQRVEISQEILNLLAAMEAALERDRESPERERTEARNDIAALRQELAREQPRRAVVKAILGTLGDLSSLASLALQLHPLLMQLPLLGG
jgi:hypothetical protein